VTDPHSPAGPPNPHPPAQDGVWRAPAAFDSPVPDPRGAPPEPVARRRWWHRRPDSRKTPDRPCLNCGDPTVGQFCPTCGQRKVDVRVSLRRMLREVMDDQLSVNSTLPRTLGALLFLPGRLTREYVQGHVVRYIPPFRLYLVTSLLFFVALSFVADPDNMSVRAVGEVNEDSVRTARIADSVLLAHARQKGEDTVKLAAAARRSGSADPGSGIQLAGADTTKVPAFVKPLLRRIDAAEERLNAMPRREALRTMIAAFEDNASAGVFVMMPLFALILKLLYVRRRRFYVEHFVFALHVHAFAFFTAGVMMLARVGALNLVLAGWFVLYLFLALKRVYGEGVVRTFVKYIILAISYTFLLVFGVTATALLSALSL
jgi:hypothetical protein